MATITTQTNIPNGSTIVVTLVGDNTNTNRFVSYQGNTINFLPVADNLAHTYKLTITSAQNCTETKNFTCTVSGCSGTCSATVKCRLYRITNNSSLQSAITYSACGTFQLMNTTVNSNSNITVCAIFNTIEVLVAVLPSLTVAEIGSC